MTRLVTSIAAATGLCLPLLAAPCAQAENSISIHCPVEIEVPTQDTVVKIPVYFTGELRKSGGAVGLNLMKIGPLSHLQRRPQIRPISRTPEPSGRTLVGSSRTRAQAGITMR